MRIKSGWSGLVLFIVSMNLLNCSTSSSGDTAADPIESQNPLLYAVAWKKTAAEYQALYHQGFNLARSIVEQALADNELDGRPVAVITDVDDTLLYTGEYWSDVITQGLDFFDDALWDSWVLSRESTASPGALAFLQFCAANNVEVFYITNRDQGDATYGNALAQLQGLNFPYADEQHLFVLQGSSNKQLTQDKIREDYNVAVLLGDNLNDFSRKYYTTDGIERQGLMEQDADLYGSQYIIFPNPTDGHWIRAIFGESEPAPTEMNRQTLRRAAQ